MKIGTRINSFIKNNKSITEVLEKIGSINGITHVDLNYPEHLRGVKLENIKAALHKKNLKVNGLALRFGKYFVNGILGNSDRLITERAKNLCKKAINITKELGGKQITIWLEYDGFDYAFQLNYTKSWNQIVNALREIADYDSKTIVSIEYKPYQSRAYSLLPDIGTTLFLINQVDRENLGVTLDFCHMLMKNENPAYSLCLAGEGGKLFGIHLNDGHQLNDDGFMVGSVNFIQTLEFIYYMKKYNYQGVIYFDTFPVREDSTVECETNIRLLRRYLKLINLIGMDEIQNIINKNNAIAAQEIFFKCIK